ncbi:MAG: NAD-dependent succinate-semialdehyde dehydrogenase [Candidatus Omnitrophota bacterium]
MAIQSINPADGKVLKTYEETKPEEVNSILEKSKEAFYRWRKTRYKERAERMKAAAGVLREKADEYARLMALEMGKPIREGRAEAQKCAWVCEYYAEKAEAFLQPEIVETDAGKSFVCFQPIGLILAVMPWNFPFWQVFRFAAPALMAGNAGLLKHASNVPGCALAIEDVFRRAGFPENIFSTLLIGGGRVEAVIEDPRIKAVTLTGSAPAGAAVARKAGEMLKKTVLELGGSDPYLILEDADLEQAVEVCAASKTINCGQSCIAAKRFIVVDSRREDFERLFVERLSRVKMSDPLQEESMIGPMARRDLRDELHRQVVKSMELGARCILGGSIPQGAGAFYPPTVLANVKKGMPAYEEELFGPVAAIIYAKNEEDAIRIANDSRFGLGAAVFTRDQAKGERLAEEELEAGCCFVNAFVKSDPRLPFGGVKESGYGRELSHYGIKEFVNIKTVYIR